MFQLPVRHSRFSIP